MFSIYIQMLLAMIFLQVVVQPWSLVAFDRARERLMCGRQVAESSLRLRRAVEKKCVWPVGSWRQMVWPHQQLYGFWILQNGVQVLKRAFSRLQGHRLFDERTRLSVRELNTYAWFTPLLRLGVEVVFGWWASQTRWEKISLMLFAKGVSQMIGKFLGVHCAKHGCATVSAQATCLSVPPSVQQKNRKGKHWQHGPPSCEMLPVQQESWLWFCVCRDPLFFVIYCFRIAS